MNGGKIRKMVLPVLLLAFLLVVSGFFLWRVYVQSQSERQSLWQSVSGLTEENSRLSEENAQWQQKFDALARSQEVQPEEYAAALASLQLFQHLPDQPSLERGASIRLKPSKKYVYLTFDDGPSENTPALLEVLGKNNVKATFFVVYNSNKQYYQDIVCAGHAIGLHSYTHDYAKIYQSEDAYFADLQQLSDYVKDTCGVESKLLRFPGGSSNTVSRHYSEGIMTRLAQRVQEKGYTYFDWNAQNGDALSGGVTAVQALKFVERFSAIDGQELPYIILLMHNSGMQGSTVEAMQSVIDYYKQRGYEFSVLTEDSPAVHQVIQN